MSFLFNCISRMKIRHSSRLFMLESSYESGNGENESFVIVTCVSIWPFGKPRKTKSWRSRVWTEGALLRAFLPNKREGVKALSNKNSTGVFFFPQDGGDDSTHHEKDKHKKKQRLERDTFPMVGAYDVPRIRRQSIDANQIELWGYTKAR